jgi:hypothetical protein
MRLAKRLAALAFVLASTSMGGAFAQKETWVQKLFKLLWPIGRYEGDLSTTVTRNTEKGSPGGFRRLYAVDTSSGRWSELRSARGAADAVVCPDGEQLFYRRETELVREILAISGNVLKTRGEPGILNGVEATRLFACVVDASNQLSLWAETTDQPPVVRVLRPGPDAWSWTDVPPELGAADAKARKKLAETLALLRSVRPDATRAFVRDWRLLQQTKAGKPTFLVDTEGPQFRGVPLWVGTTTWLVVAGSEQPQ